jgi:nitrogen regulatory protein P-II 1
MKFIKINIFIPILSLPKVEEELKKINVPGVTISKVKGYGEKMNFFSKDWLETHARIEIFCDEKDKKIICEALKKGVGSPELSDGFIAILPVESMCSLSDF